MAARLAEESQIAIDPAQVEGLERFVTLLLTWNERINLTAAASAEVVGEEHLPDAFALAARVAPSVAVVDVGSGGGLPALPLAILRPDLRLTLVEPIAKKVAFLRTAVRELGLGARVAVRAERATPGHPGDAFDAAVSRATLPPSGWVELGATLVRPGGRIFVLTSPGAATTLDRPSLVQVFSRAYLGGRRLLVELERVPLPRST